jgi:hypothetical protein
VSGRVTIACCWGKCAIPASIANRWSGGDQDKDNEHFVCVKHESTERRRDSRDLTYSVYAPLINPGTCSDSDVANVHAAIEALCRLLRTCGDSPEDREDRAVLELCAQEVRGAYYEPCDAPGWNFDGGERHNVRHDDDGGSTRCMRCNGSGLVLRRRSDGTAVVDEIDAGSVAA